MATHSSVLAGRIQRQRALEGSSPRCRREEVCGGGGSTPCLRYMSAAPSSVSSALNSCQLSALAASHVKDRFSPLGAGTPLRPSSARPWGRASSRPPGGQGPLMEPVVPVIAHVPGVL